MEIIAIIDILNDLDDFFGLAWNDSINSKLDYKDKSIRNQRKQTEAKRLEERNKAAARKKAEKTKAWSIQKDKVSRIVTNTVFYLDHSNRFIFVSETKEGIKTKTEGRSSE